MECLFSYGTLQQKNVQLKNFGRILVGSKDVLQKYILKEVEITDESVLKISNKRFHPILFFSNNEKDEVHGSVFKITSSELFVWIDVQATNTIAIINRFLSFIILIIEFT